METEAPFTALAPPVFNGDNYHVWAVRMETHLEANDLWEAVEEDYVIAPLPNNPTMAQIKLHKERRQKKSKAKASLFAAVSSSVFTRIMHLKTASEVWNYLKKEYGGDERIRSMKSLNLIREFDIQRMTENETVKQYTDRLLGIANQVRLLGTTFDDARIVQKIMISVPERFEATISALENVKDLATISLSELLSALQAQEQRRSMRQGAVVEGALKASPYSSAANKQWKKEAYKRFGDNKTGEGNEQGFSPCPHCRKTNHPPERCWWRPDVRCHKCNMTGHIQKVCKNISQNEAAAGVEEMTQEEVLLVATSLDVEHTQRQWVVDSGCTHHMTNDLKLLKDFKKSTRPKVKIGNGDLLWAEGSGTATMEGLGGIKIFLDVLYVPKIDQSLLSIGQLLEEGFRVVFEDKRCTIMDAKGRMVLSIDMKEKSFTVGQTAIKQAAVQRETNNPEALVKKKNEGMAKELPVLEEDFSQCIITHQQGKQLWKAFSKQTQPQKTMENAKKKRKETKRKKKYSEK